MDQNNKAVEAMKAAMEKEYTMKENTKETLLDDEKDGQPEGAEDVIVEDTEAMMEQEEVEAELAAEVTDEGLEDTDSEGDQSEKTSKSGKSFFKSGKSKELAAKDVKIEELNDRLIRTMAEYDNFRKRSEKEKSQMFEIGAKSVIETILPVVDNFERGIGSVSESEKDNAFVQGIEMIYKQLMTSLEDIGVKPIEAIGKEFDPNYHNAVMHGEDDSLGENIVSEEFQKGYLYRDTVVRHSMVKVVN